VGLAFVAGFLIAKATVGPKAPDEGLVDKAYLPYYIVALSLLSPNSDEFTKRLGEAFRQTEESFSASETREALCLSPDGKALVKTIAACNRLSDHVVQETREKCGIGLNVPLVEERPAPDKRKTQKEKPDAQLTEGEKKLEREFAKSGIAKKKYEPDVHDCDDFAYRGYKWLKGLYGNRASVKWYSYKNPAGTQVGHALNDIHWPDGTKTYFEPQTGQVVELPENRTQTFESTDEKEIDRRQDEETKREKKKQP
jgi:hypothetical protein